MLLLLNLEINAKNGYFYPKSYPILQDFALLLCNNGILFIF